MEEETALRPLLSPSVPRIIPPRHARTPSRSPTRLRIRDDLLSDLTPATILRAFRNPTGKLKIAIESASIQEREFALRAVHAGNSVQEWLDELTSWPWPTGVAGWEAPPKKDENETEADKAKDDGNSQPAEKDQHYGSLLGLEIENYQQRICDIGGELEDIKLKEMQDHVRNTHFSPNSRPSSSASNAPPPNFLSSRLYNRLDDLTAVIIKTVLDTLPLLSNLRKLMDVWSIRLDVLLGVPALLESQEVAVHAMEEAWKQIKPENRASPLDWSTYMRMEQDLDEQVKIAGRHMDDALDELQRTSEQLPDEWADVVDKLDAELPRWSEAAREAVKRAEWEAAEKARLGREEAAQRARHESLEAARIQIEQATKAREEAQAAENARQIAIEADILAAEKNAREAAEKATALEAARTRSLETAHHPAEQSSFADRRYSDEEVEAFRADLESYPNPGSPYKSPKKWSQMTPPEAMQLELEIARTATPAARAASFGSIRSSLKPADGDAQTKPQPIHYSKVREVTNELLSVAHKASSNVPPKTFHEAKRGDVSTSTKLPEEPNSEFQNSRPERDVPGNATSPETLGLEASIASTSHPESSSAESQQRSLPTTTTQYAPADSHAQTTEMGLPVLVPFGVGVAAGPLWKWSQSGSPAPGETPESKPGCDCPLVDGSNGYDDDSAPSRVIKDTIPEIDDLRPAADKQTLIADNSRDVMPQDQNWDLAVSDNATPTTEATENVVQRDPNHQDAAVEEKCTSITSQEGHDPDAEDSHFDPDLRFSKHFPPADSADVQAQDDQDQAEADVSMTQKRSPAKSRPVSLVLKPLKFISSRQSSPAPTPSPRSPKLPLSIQEYLASKRRSTSSGEASPSPRTSIDLQHRSYHSEASPEALLPSNSPKTPFTPSFDGAAESCIRGNGDDEHLEPARVFEASSRLARATSGEFIPDTHSAVSGSEPGRHKAVSLGSAYTPSDPTPEIHDTESTEYFKSELSPVNSISSHLEDVALPSTEVSTADSFPGVLESSPIFTKRVEHTYDSPRTIMTSVPEESDAHLPHICNSDGGCDACEEIEQNGQFETPSDTSPSTPHESSVAGPGDALRRLSLPRRQSTSSETTVITNLPAYIPSSPVATPTSGLSETFPETYEDSPLAGRVGNRDTSYDISPPGSPKAAATKHHALTLLRSPDFLTSDPFPSQSSPLDAPEIDDMDSSYASSEAGEAPVFDGIQITNEPAQVSPKKATTSEQLQQQISTVLKAVPAIRLKEPTTTPLSTRPTAFTSSSLKAPKIRRSLTPSLPSLRSTSSMSNHSNTSHTSRAPTPSFTITRAKNQNNTEIKTYHLSRTNGLGKAKVINLFVRLTGENGERVMVRVGGGWADLGEYLKEYASHHGRRDMVEGEDKVEFQASRVASTSSRIPSASSRIPSSTSTTSTIRGNGRRTPLPPRSASSMTNRPGVERSGSSLNIRKTREKESTAASAIPVRVPDSRNPSTPAPSFSRRGFSATPPSAGSPGSPHSSAYGEERSNLGLSGPIGKDHNLPERSLEWVRTSQAKIKSSADQETKIGNRGVREGSAGPGSGSGGRESRNAARDRGSSFGEMGRVGGTKRLFPKRDLGGDH